MTVGRVISAEERTAWKSAKDWRERAQNSEKREIEARVLADKQSAQIAAIAARHTEFDGFCEECDLDYPCPTAVAIGVER